MGKVNGTGSAKDGRSNGIGRVSINQIEQLLGNNIDLLRNVTDSVVKQGLKEKVYQNPYERLNSSLLADSEHSSSLIVEVLGNISAWHDGVFIESINRDIELPNGVEETGFSKNSSTSVTPRNISPFQIGSSEVDSTKPSITQISSFQVSLSEVGVIELSPLQVSPRQIDSAHIDFMRQTDINEVSLTPSIPFSQFFNRNSGSEEFVGNFDDFLVGKVVSGISPKLVSNVPPSSHFSLMFDGVNDGTRHDISPAILDSFRASLTQLWNNIATIDIDFQITDLPTGQLAEATITQFDPSGRPSAGILSIDYNANGVG